MDYSHILHRFPLLELSYETFAHKKVPSNYDICMAIPTGKNSSSGSPTTTPMILRSLLTSTSPSKSLK